MDALALLCTLHADGPATLKRLRARGYSDLVALIQRSADELSADLDVEPAYARRLLREAKHLAVRVGAEGLEAEEAPPVATVPSRDDREEAVAEPLPPSIPIAAVPAMEATSTLDESDRSLVERIVGLSAPVAPLDPVEVKSVEPEVPAAYSAAYFRCVLCWGPCPDRRATRCRAHRSAGRTACGCRGSARARSCAHPGRSCSRSRISRSACVLRTRLPHGRVSPWARR